MQLSKEAIEEFRTLYAEAFNEGISVADATVMAHNLIHLYKALAKPLPEELSAREEPKKSPPPSSLSAS